MTDIEKERKKVLEESQDQEDYYDTRPSSRIADREDDYHAQRLKRQLSPDGASYGETLKEAELVRERHEVERKIQQQMDKEKEEEGGMADGRVRKRRWDMPTPDASSATDEWDATPRTSKRASRWDATPVAPTGPSETPRRSRWDETPVGTGTGAETPLRTTTSAFAFDTGPEHFFPTNMGGGEAAVDDRNGLWTDEDLDALLPAEGYAILAAPANYAPIRTPSRKLMATPLVTGGFSMAASGAPLAVPGSEDLPAVRPDELQYFGRLFEEPKGELSLEEARERKIMKLLLKIKSGTAQQRRGALRQITEKAREFGAGPLFDQLLPLLMSPGLEEQERHLLVKVIDRVLYGLEGLVRPYIHRILVVLEPLLIEEDRCARQEGRELVANLAKAAGLAPMIAALRPDLEHQDEYVRNTTARAFAVVGTALGIPALLPFLRAVCGSKKSWYARHTGIKIVQQIAVLAGCGVLPHLPGLVGCVAPGLDDQQARVRTISALAIAALAEASAPHGLEAFAPVLPGLWRGLREHRGKALAAVLRAAGQLVPLMDEAHAERYARDLLSNHLPRHLATPDEEMKRIVLKVLKQCAATPGVPAALLRSDVLPDYFRHMWVRRSALDRRTARALVETTLAVAERTGLPDVLGRLLPGLKDESEPFRRLAVETAGLLLARLGAASLDGRMEEHLLDGLLFAFQEQTTDDGAYIIMNAFGSAAEALGALRLRPYMPQLASMVLWRLGNRSTKVRQLAADLVARLTPALQHPDGGEAERGGPASTTELLGKLSLVLYENLGEEYPDVLASILGALKAILVGLGVSRMTPPIKDLLPRLTPILRNRHERVQEACIELVGRIAERSPEAVSAREWMRICFELLDILRSPRKAVRRAALNTFGYIAKAIGPQDVLAALLNNLRVQERQNRVCTTVAVAIVAEACGPFTVLPALMAEYRVPELNVQNGVLKALAFLFEYVGELGKDYVFAVTPLLEDALTDRDQVHRQTAATVIKHMALGVPGWGCEEALLHLLNHALPSLFDPSPHLFNALLEALDALRVGLGPATLLLYLAQGLFHPARRVRSTYWVFYNNLYLASQDALVPVYPRITQEDPVVAPHHNLQYSRHVLDIVI